MPSLRGAFSLDDLYPALAFVTALATPLAATLPAPAFGQETQEAPSGDEALGARSPIFDLPSPRPTFHAEAGAQLHAAPDPYSGVLQFLDVEADLEILEARPGWVRVQWGHRLGWLATGPFERLDPLEEASLPPLAPEVPVWSPAADVQRLERARAILGPGLNESRLGPFTLLTDVSRKAMIERFLPLASDLPRAYEERLGIAPRRKVETAVVLFAREADYRRYEDELDIGADSGVAGHAGRGVAALFVGKRPREEVQTVLIHELTHLLNRLSLGRDLPAWLEEGLANDLAYCEADGEGRLRLGTLGGEQMVRGRGPGTVVLRLSGPRAALESALRNQAEHRSLPLTVLLDLAWSEFVYPEGREARYIQSTFLVRFLLDGQRGAHAAAFRGWIEALAAGGGREPGEFFSRLGGTPERLEREFDAWLRSQSLN
jgi:hypothetical protein